MGKSSNSIGGEVVKEVGEIIKEVLGLPTSDRPSGTVKEDSPKPSGPAYDWDD